MREIKFRQFIGGKMVYWGFLEDGSFFGPSANGANSENAQNTPHMQYTGLKDKNGKDVFEGDIVRLIERGGYIKATGNIAWRNARYYLQRGSEEDRSLFSPTYPENLEIIGNIYENPELLTA